MPLNHFFSEYLIWLLLTIPALCWYLGKRPAALYLFASVVTAWLISQLVKEFFFLPRPFPLQLSDGTFPSSHSAVSFAIACGLTLQFGRKVSPIFLLSLAVGYGRIATGAHYLLDVVGGGLLGLLAAMGYRYINFELLLKRFKH